MDGILIINKPSNYTSHDVVAKARKILNTKCIGHTGTLDPMATGVLVLCIGQATKLSQYLICDEKVYDVEMKLGIKTDTGDITGNVIEEIYGSEICRVGNLPPETIDIIKSFIGKQKQLPPMYSAIKIDGKKLYEYAREGIEVERESRDIEIFDISNIMISDETIKYRVHCSKGTYIRVLCEDIAEKLGTVGTMTMLNRVKSGSFDIKDSVDLEKISEDNIISIEKLFDKKIILNKDIDKLLNGVGLYYDLPDGLYNLYNDKYIGIGKITNKYLKREIIL